MNGAQIATSEVDSIPGTQANIAERSEITLVPRQPEDHEFLCGVYASTRTEEVAQTGWPMEQQEAFLRMQFEAQTKAYAMQTPTAEHSLIHFRGARVGRTIVERTPTEIHLVDIALLPAYRKHRIGSLLMADLMAEAAKTGRRIRLYVERFNPALRWYTRMGFQVSQEGPIYLEMIWRADNLQTSEDQA